MRRLTVVSIVSLFFIVGLAAAAGAVTERSRDAEYYGFSPGARAHDGGFFLRLSLGIAGGKSSIDNIPTVPPTDWEISGTGGDLNIAIGGIVSENLAIHGTVFGWTVTDPDIEVRNVNGSITVPVQGDFTFTGVGAGLTYFFMPVNIYMSGSLGLGRLSFEGADSDTGLGLEACAGKEWWVSDRWALGVALGVTYHSIGETGVDEHWSGASFGVRFSATLN